MAAADDPYYFDAKAVERRIEFVEGNLRLWQGEHAGKLIKLLSWQRDAISELFGWRRRADGLRKYRQAYFEVPKKNGKTPFAAALDLCCLYVDDEPGAEVYCCAADRYQAGLVFTDAYRMVEQSEGLRELSTLFRRSIVFGTSKLEVLSSDVKGKHGIRPSAATFDEFHAMPNRDLYDAVFMGTATRRQPLTVIITTAGVGTNSICYELHDYASKILRGVIIDPTFLAVIYAAEPDDDWTSEEVWARANPGLGVTVKLDYLRAQCARALQTPAYQNSFRRFHLNQWTGQVERAIDISKWDACDAPVNLWALRRRRCFLGMDLSSRLDLTSVVAVFLPDPERGEDFYTVLPFFWVPEENLLDRARVDMAPYDAWERDGYLEATPGNLVDQGAIRKRIRQLGRIFRVVQVGFDSWNAAVMQTWLSDEDGFDTVEMRQGFKTMSAPTKELLGLVADRRLRHGGHPVLRWNVDNFAVRKDPNDNIAPCKRKSTQRIDGVVALVMALGRAMLGIEEVSCYERPGMGV